MSSTLKYINCPVSQPDLLESIGVQTQVESFKDIEYLPTSSIQDGVPITFEYQWSTNHTKVMESSNNYAYKAMLETLLTYDDADERSFCVCLFFKKDHGNITAEFPTATHANKRLVE